MAENRGKTKKRQRRNTISEMSNEKGSDKDQLRCSGILSPDHKKKKEDEKNTEPKEVMTFNRFATRAVHGRIYGPLTINQIRA